MESTGKEKDKFYVTYATRYTTPRRVWGEAKDEYEIFFTEEEAKEKFETFKQEEDVAAAGYAQIKDTTDCY